MEESINELLVDLKIMSMIQPNSKLYLHNGFLALEPASILQPIRRFMSNSNRYVISVKIKQRLLELEKLLEEKQIKHEWIMYVIENLIEPVKIGISHLQKTYGEDSQINATFDLFIARLVNIHNMHFLKEI